jgi:hypothetical protein
MKPVFWKLIATVIVVSAGALYLVFFQSDNTSETSGTVWVEIADSDGTLVFEGDLPFEEGDTFFDVLERRFDMTCATADYKPDTSCDVITFFGIGYTGRVVLGIKDDTFDIMTDWQTSFLAFLVFDGNGYVLATNGVSQIPFSDNDRIRIEKRDPEGR